MANKTVVAERLVTAIDTLIALFLFLLGLRDPVLCKNSMPLKNWPEKTLQRA
jgi:hypothetical protein